ncbi:MAG: DoxX family membrane protein [Ekhidna sp.]
MTTENKSLRIAATVVRYLMGLIFLVFGLNGFLNFLPPPPMEGDLVTFMGGLMASGYFFPLLKATEVLAGVLLLSGFYVPLAIAVLGPITLNIFFVHASMEPSGLPIAIFVFLANLFLAYAYKENFKGIFQKK